MSRTLLAGLASLAFAAAVFAAGPAAAVYPERPITLIIPWQAGGGSDVTGRLVGQLLQRELGVPVRVENLSGGQGVVGHKAIAAAAPDGYTIGVITTEIATMHWAGISELSADDYQYIGLFNADPAGVQVRMDSRWRDLRELLRDVTANPGRYKSSGTSKGGIWHIALAGMLTHAGIDPLASPWVAAQGAAPALRELASGGLDIVTCSPTEAADLRQSGKVRTLAVMHPLRMAAYPGIPTLREAANLDFAVSAWRGIAAPKGLPGEASGVLATALLKVVESGDFARAMAAGGFEVFYKGPVEMEAFVRDNDRTMGRIMAEIGLAK